MTDERKPWAGLTEGRIVHVRTPGISHCQPAIVVRAWRDFPGEHDNGGANMLLFPDGSNDGAAPVGLGQYALVWLTSIPHEESAIYASTVVVYPNTRSWHWPERVDE